MLFGFVGSYVRHRQVRQLAGCAPRENAGQKAGQRVARRPVCLRTNSIRTRGIYFTTVIFFVKTRADVSIFTK
jgi:hypothetical protein